MVAKSRTAETYEILQRDLLNGIYAPGSRLRIDLIGEALEVSPGAVREALARLTSDGLVVAEPQRGFVVATASTEDLIDLTAVRIDIETRCLRRSVLLGTVEWEANLIAALHRLSQAKLAPDPGGNGSVSEDWTRLHTKFHDSLVAACDSRWWLRLRDQLYIQAERYRRMLRYGRVDRDIKSEHDAIAEAVLSRDAERACALLTNHLQRTADILLASNAPFTDVP